MGKGGGGGIDTSGLEKAAAESNALQKQIYEQTREDFQPWYSAGVGGINRLADLLGISGGSVQNRDQLYNELLPQYTTTTQASTGDTFITPDGRVITRDTYGNVLADNQRDQAEMYFNALDRGLQSEIDMFQGMGYQPLNQTQGTSTTDYEALNAAIDAQLAGQQTPEDYGSLLQKFSMDQFQEDPSYQFRQDEAQKALERQLAAQGVTLGGAGYGEINPQAARYMTELSQDIASQEYGNAYNRYVNDQLNTFNMLMGVSGMGAGITGQQAAAGQNYATNVGQTTTDLASAQLNAQIANASRPSMFQTLLGGAATLGGAYLSGGGSLFGGGASGGLTSIANPNIAGTSYLLSDIRLKENIKLVGVDQGHNIYEFDYKDGSGRYRGVMAHEVQKLDPDAVMEMPNGYLAVNYDKIGLEMERV